MNVTVPNNGSMKDVPEDLSVLVEQAFAEARRMLENTGNMEPLIMVRTAQGEVHTLNLGMAGNIMNSGRGKELLFGSLRQAVAMTGATAVVILTDTWVGTATEKQMLDPVGAKKFFEGEHSFDEAIERGWAERGEALAAVVQDERQVVIISQFYLRGDDTVRFEERKVAVLTQDQFKGRQKMYGITSEADIR